MVPVNASLPYGSPRPAEWEEIKVRTVHRGRHWRVEEIAVFCLKRLAKNHEIPLFRRTCRVLSRTRDNRFTVLTDLLSLNLKTMQRVAARHTKLAAGSHKLGTSCHRWTRFWDTIIPLCLTSPSMAQAITTMSIRIYLQEKLFFWRRMLKIKLSLSPS